uniref:Tripartite motif containing 101 n=1 Tax=Mola mola TaxID=94237 RepID=A0A3Q3WGL7_MOLML
YFLPLNIVCLQDEATLAMLEKQLMCPICLELFNNPVVILPCQHNLCRKCANQLYQVLTTVASSVRFRCPSCRQGVVLDRHGVYGLPRNLLVENIVNIYKQEVSNNSATSPLPPPPALPGQVTCSDHEDEKVNIYCVSCQVLTCSLCKVFGAHQSCQVAPMTDVYQQQKVTDSWGTPHFMNLLTDSWPLKENSGIFQPKLTCACSYLFLLCVMTQRISSEQEEKTGHVQALMCFYGDSVETNRKLMERAASGMEEPDMAAFVQVGRAASGCYPADTLKPGDECLSHYRYDFSRQERALRSIAFIKVQRVRGGSFSSSCITTDMCHSSARHHQESPLTSSFLLHLAVFVASSLFFLFFLPPSPLQAVTLIFYLLAFLVLLQRVWAYVGCFVCT